MKNTCWLLALFVVLGCGSDDNEGGRYVSGVDGSKDVSMLDTTEKQQLCDTVDAYVQAQIDFDTIAYVSCIPVAIWTTTDVNACKQKLNDCMELFPRPITVDAKLQSDLACITSLSQCQTTVAELEGCVDVSLQRTLSILDWTCDFAGDPSTRMVAEPKPDVRVCTNVNAACNQFATPGPE